MAIIKELNGGPSDSSDWESEEEEIPLLANTQGDSSDDDGAAGQLNESDEDSDEEDEGEEIEDEEEEREEMEDEEEEKEEMEDEEDEDEGEAMEDEENSQNEEEDEGVQKKDFSNDGLESYDEEDILDNDEEIQAFLASRKFQPGATYEEDKNLTKEYPNLVPELKQKLKEIKFKAAWTERLDVTCEAAPVAPEMEMQIREDRKIKQAKKEPKLQNPFADMSVLNDDFERECYFQRHAQAAVLTALPLLRAHDIKTHRPEDYYGQMIKGDHHMQKIRRKLQEKLLSQQASDHAKKIRKLRKYGKQVQTEVLLTKAAKKKEMMTKLKQYRAGQISQLDFLKDDIGSSQSANDENGGLFTKKKSAPAARSKGNSRRSFNEVIGDMGLGNESRGTGSFSGGRGRGGRGSSGVRGRGNSRGRGGGNFRGGRGGGSSRGSAGGRGGGSFRGAGGRGGGGGRGGAGGSRGGRGNTRGGNRPGRGRRQSSK